MWISSKDDDALPRLLARRTKKGIVIMQSSKYDMIDLLDFGIFLA